MRFLFAEFSEHIIHVLLGGPPNAIPKIDVTVTQDDRGLSPSGPSKRDGLWRQVAVQDATIC